MLLRRLAHWTEKTQSWEWVFPLSYMAVILSLSSIHGDTPTFLMGDVFQWVPPDVQNTLHVPVYGGLSYLWCRTLKSWRLEPIGVMVLACLLTGVFGVLDEWYQYYVPGRFSAATDVVLNWLGAACGIAGYRFVLMRSSRPAE